MPVGLVSFACNAIRGIDLPGIPSASFPQSEKPGFEDEMTVYQDQLAWLVLTNKETPSGKDSITQTFKSTDGGCRRPITRGGIAFCPTSAPCSNWFQLGRPRTVSLRSYIHRPPAPPCPLSPSPRPRTYRKELHIMQRPQIASRVLWYWFGFCNTKSRQNFARRSDVDRDNKSLSASRNVSEV